MSKTHPKHIIVMTGATSGIGAQAVKQLVPCLTRWFSLVCVRSGWEAFLARLIRLILKKADFVGRSAQMCSQRGGRTDVAVYSMKDVMGGGVHETKRVCESC